MFCFLSGVQPCSAIQPRLWSKSNNDATTQELPPWFGHQSCQDPFKCSIHQSNPDILCTVPPLMFTCIFEDLPHHAAWLVMLHVFWVKVRCVLSMRIIHYRVYFDMMRVIIGCIMYEDNCEYTSSRVHLFTYIDIYIDQSPRVLESTIIGFSGIYNAFWNSLSKESPDRWKEVVELST